MDTSQILTAVVTIWLAISVLIAIIAGDLLNAYGYHFASICVFWPIWLIALIIKLLVVTVIQLFKFTFSKE